jgi:hypothetical protein
VQIKGKMMKNISREPRQDDTKETANEKYQPRAEEARRENSKDTLKDWVENTFDANPEGGNRQKGVRDNNNS